jgi:hypothetical protein
MEDYEFWAGTEKFEVRPGLFGENMTLRNLDLGGAVIGERWRVGSALLEVAQPRLPCFKLGIRVGDAEFPKRFQLALRPGAYLRIIEEGAPTGWRHRRRNLPPGSWRDRSARRGISTRSGEGARPCGRSRASG